VITRVIGLLRGALPPGTIAVGGGLAVLGLAAYVFLALAGHTLSPGGYSSFSVLWVIIFAVGPGLFFPLEQELARVIAARATRGEPPGAVVRRVSLLAAGFLAVLLVLTAVGANWLSDQLFDGDTAMTALLMVNLLALSLAHLSRGILAGTGQFIRYGVQLGLDGTLRCVLAAVVAALGEASAARFAVALAVAQFISIAATSTGLLRLPRGEEVAWSEVSAGLGLLLTSSLLSGLVANIGVVIAELLTTEEALAGELLSGWVLARVPLFIYASIQAALLPNLSRALASGDRAGYRRLMVQGVAAVVALGLAGTAVCVAMGPWLVSVLFDGQGLLSRADFGWLSIATTVYMVAMVLGQGVLAQGRHGAQAVGWIVGFSVLVAATFLPVGVLGRVEGGYLLGSAAAAVALGALMTRPVTDLPSPVETISGGAR